jgi:hypothetical protein
MKVLMIERSLPRKEIANKLINFGANGVNVFRAPS